MADSGLVIALFGLAMSACGSASAGNCTTSTCTSGPARGQTVKVCAHPDGSVTYEFGGSTCTCAISSSSGCSCGQKVLDWCGPSVGSDGGSGDGADGGGGGDRDGGVVVGADGGSDGAVAHSCMVTFSGAVSATAGCVGTFSYDGVADQWRFVGGGGSLSGTAYVWSGPDITFRGKPQAATFNHTQAVSSRSFITFSSGAHANDPTWGESYSYNGAEEGMLTLTLTSLGPSVDGVDNGKTYPNPHGSVAGTLIQENPGATAPSVQMTMTF